MAKKSAEINMSLHDLISGTGVEVKVGDLNTMVCGIVADSRKAGPGKLFVALKGETVDGHDFLDKVVELGCLAVVVEKRMSGKISQNPGVVVLVAEDGRQAMAELAANFYGHPELQLKMIGITGTNGKTTTSYLLESMLLAGTQVPGVIGTVNYRFGGCEEGASFTTPEPLDLYRIMREMVDYGVDHLIIEVSSHALIQRRLHGINFDVAAFTNLSHEHLDFHGDMAGYFAAKSKLFLEHLKEGGIAVVMLADEEELAAQEEAWGDRLTADLLLSGRFRDYKHKNEVAAGRATNLLLTCGCKRGDIHVASAEVSLEGIRAEIVGLEKNITFNSPLVGDFNLLNMATAIGLGHVLGLNDGQIGQGIAKSDCVPGRLERVRLEDAAKSGQCRVFVDFAHTPDALSGVLQSVRRLCKGRLIVVFGCGGDRDKSKRPIMGEIAGRLADFIVITTDNSRSEEPSAIMGDIEGGLVVEGGCFLAKGRLRDLQASGRRGYDLIESRREAIGQAITVAGPDDVVLICGKGHENYQLVGNQRLFFDDRLEARNQLSVLADSVSR